RLALTVQANSAKIGAAMYFDGSSSANTSGAVVIAGNSIGDGNSAAIELVNSSKIDWTPAPGASLAFSKNVGSASGNILDLLISDGSFISLGKVSFSPGGSQSTRTDDNDYNTSGSLSMVQCDASTCTLTP